METLIVKITVFSAILNENGGLIFGHLHAQIRIFITICSKSVSEFMQVLRFILAKTKQSQS